MDASSILKSLGTTGSGLDVKSIVAGLVDAQKAPTTKKLDVKEASIKQQISAYGELKSKLADFQTKLSTLKTESTFKQRSASVEQTAAGVTVATATAATTATAAAYDLEVTQLAKAQSLSTTGGNTLFTSLTDVIGTGAVQVRFGTTAGTPGNAYNFTNDSTLATQTITLTGANNTLASFRDYINAGSYGFTVSTLYDGTNYTLVLTGSQTGAKNSLQLTVTGDGDGNDVNNSGLSRLNFNAGPAALTQGNAAQNATVRLNNITINPSSNTVTDAIPGVTLTLKNTNTNNAVKINVTADNSAVESKVGDFVSAFNTLKTKLNDLTVYDAATGEKGIFLGNSTTTNIKRLLSNELTQSVTNLSGNYRALADLGITTNTADGTLLLDTDKFNAAVTADVNQVARVFGITTSATNSGVSYSGSTSDTVAGTYAVNVTALATKGLAVNGVQTVTITGANDSFNIQVDGVSSGVIQLTDAVYGGPAALAVEVQNKINADTSLVAGGKSVTVAVTNGTNFTITSASYGSSSTILFATLPGFLQAGTVAAGVDIAGTINGVPTTGTGQYLVSNSGNSKGLQLKITSTVLGALGTVNFTRGKADTLNTLVDRLIQSTGLIAQNTTSANDQLISINSQRETLNKRTAAYEARLTKQFNALDRAVSSLKSQSDFLTQALAGLAANQGVNKKK